MCVLRFAERAGKASYAVERAHHEVRQLPSGALDALFIARALSCAKVLRGLEDAGGDHRGMQVIEQRAQGIVQYQRVTAGSARGGNEGG